MKRNNIILTVSILIFVSIAIYMAVSYTRCDKSIFIVVREKNGQQMTIDGANITNALLEKMPYSTAKHKQFQTIISVNDQTKKSLLLFTQKNLGKTVSVYFCNQWFADVSIVTPANEILLSTLNVDVSRTLKLLNRITSHVEYKER